MDRAKLSLGIRLVGALTALSLWGISVYFSADGFGIIMPEVKWIGWILAIAVTVLELVFLEEGEKHTVTLYLIGLLAYVYGVATNVVGLLASQGHALSEIVDKPYLVLFPLLLGIILEITPEPLIEYCLTGANLADFISSIFNNTNSGVGRSRLPQRQGPNRWGGENDTTRNTG